MNRGAASSEGHTSWTSKPEQADYASVVGFLAYYVYHLEKPASHRSSSPDIRKPPILLMAGYSYGAMVTTRLPPLDAILASFETPAIHTAEADIRLRAQHLAEAWNAEQAAVADLASPSPSSPRRSCGVRVGGDEERVERRGKRRSGSGKARNLESYNEDGAGDGERTPPRHDEFQREERIRESVRGLLARAKLVHRKPTHRIGENENEMERCLEGVEGGITFRSAYLAVSPPVGFVTRLATMSFANPFSASWMRRSGGTTEAQQHHDAVSDESSSSSPLATNPTLVVYGDQDSFISRRKIREWTALLARGTGSRFRFVEVSGAGHFWIEGDTWFRCECAFWFHFVYLFDLFCDICSLTPSPTPLAFSSNCPPLA